VTREGRRPPGASPRGARAGRLRPLAIALVVSCMALAAHWPALRNGFVFDDHYEIEENRTLREPFSLSTLLWSEYWGPGSQTGWYRPVPLVVQKLIFDRYGVHPAPYHALVLGVHVLLAGLLGWLLAARFSLPRGALAAGALFAVHTVHSEAVSTAYGLKEVLAALLAFGALVVLTGWREDAPWTRLFRVLGAGVLLALAILSKESAAPVPAALFAADLLRGAPFARWRDAFRRNGRAAMLHGAFFASVAVGAVSMRFPVVGRLLLTSPYDVYTNPIAGMHQLDRLAMGLKIATLYGRMLVWPIPFTVSYAAGAVPPPAALWSPVVLIGALLVIALAAAVLIAPRIRPPGGTGAVWALSTYLLASNLLFPFSTMMSERFLYLPSLGLALMIAGPLDRVLAGPTREGASGARRALAAAGLTVLVLALGALSVRRASAYGDDAALTRAGWRWYPGGAIARLGHADDLMGQGRYDEAEAELQRLLRDNPTLPRAEERLAMNAEAAGREADARAHWGRAVLHPGADAGTYQAYAESLVRAGDLDEALRQLNLAIRAGTGSYNNLARVRELRGTILLRRGRTVQGLADLRAAVAIDPWSPSAQEDLAGALEAWGDAAGAEKALRTALDLVPDRPASLGRLARLLLSQGRADEAIPLLERLCALQPRDLRARSDLATSLVRVRRLDRARVLFEEILAQDPRHLVALATLGSMEEAEGRPDAARRLFERYLETNPPDNALTASVRSRAARLANGQ
jgi:tetratricopeptide (TPR) repeat protein